MRGKKVQVRPGKTNSTFGFAAGIVFVLIGLTFAIPVFGLFGVFWTAVAVLITIQNYLNAFTEKGVPTHEVTIETAEDAGSQAVWDAGNQPAEDIEAKLKQLNSLLDQDLITYEEYQKKREELLARF